MDPDAAAERIVNAIADQDWDEAKDAYDDLIEWRDKGGHMTIRANNALSAFESAKRAPGFPGKEGHWYTR